MDEPSHSKGSGESKAPKNQQDHCNCPKHVCAFLYSTFARSHLEAAQAPSIYLIKLLKQYSSHRVMVSEFRYLRTGQGQEQALLHQDEWDRSRLALDLDVATKALAQDPASAIKSRLGGRNGDLQFCRRVLGRHLPHVAQ